MTHTIERTQVTATQLLQALATAVNKDTNENYVSFDFQHGHRNGELFLSFDLNDEQVVHMDMQVSYTVIDADYDGSAVCSDIDGIRVMQISIGDGYEQESIEVAGINEHNLAPLLTIFFDKHNNRVDWQEPNYCVNLISEYARNRGQNWLLISDAA